MERDTVGQHDNGLWVEARRDRLTASNFGAVIKRKDSTPCHNLVKRLLYPRELHTKAVMHGRLYEPVALAYYERTTNTKVEPAGIFVDAERPYLGASPDGLIGTTGIVEVKCPCTIEGTGTIHQAALQKSFFLSANEAGELRLKSNHNYYYQIQGQLAITNRDFCHLVVCASTDQLILTIDRDDNLWRSFMLPKLQRFYVDCILPELADGRQHRGLKMRDPEYIRAAVAAAAEKALTKTISKKRQKMSS